MSSYAEVTAKNAKQTAEEKAAKPIPQLEVTSSQSDQVKVVNQDEASRLKDRSLKSTTSNMSDAKKVPTPGDDKIPKMCESVKELSDKALEKTKEVSEITKKELQNPVVATNVGLWAAIISGVTYFAVRKGGVVIDKAHIMASDRNKILTATAVVGAVAITAADVVLSKKYYTKYSK
ncbi:uncharacterized protein V1510DRAFT_409380 [Dipodascopsis tothii]|uniref:uncharacterized protein n=1 Tax=Dipodascopsis tothii TaxID=44089 RepID=UPI0034CFC861